MDVEHFTHLRGGSVLLLLVANEDGSLKIHANENITLLDKLNNPTQILKFWEKL